MPVVNETGRTLAAVVHELKDEIKEFIQTRISMLKAELRDKLEAWKVSLPLVIVAVVLMGTAWLVLTAALVAIIAVAFRPSPFAAFYALAIVGVVYLVGGAFCAAFALAEMRKNGIVPERTLKILKEDGLWLRTEANAKPGKA